MINIKTNDKNEIFQIHALSVVKIKFEQSKIEITQLGSDQKFKFSKETF